MRLSKVTFKNEEIYRKAIIQERFNHIRHFFLYSVQGTLMCSFHVSAIKCGLKFVQILKMNQALCHTLGKLFIRLK